MSFKLIEGIGVIADSYRRLDADEQQEDEWKHASLVLDLFCFYFFLTIQIVSVCAIFVPLASELPSR